LLRALLAELLVELERPEELPAELRALLAELLVELERPEELPEELRERPEERPEVPRPATGTA
jgi:hypothetical protein